LIIEIFRNKVLFPNDLFHCALVNSRFIDAVRKSLYEEVDLSLESGVIDEGDDDPEPICLYSSQSWQLTRTLKDHEEVAKYVRELNSETTTYHYVEAADIGVETSPRLALGTLLRLAPQLKKIKFTSGWQPGIAELDLLKRFPNVDELSVGPLILDDLKTIADRLPHLKVLKSQRIGANPSGLPAIIVDNLRCLETVDFPSLNLNLDLPFLTTSASTLRVLRVSLDVAVALDYSKYPNLHELGLYRMPSGSSRDGSKADRIGRRFWESLAKSPSLRILSCTAVRQPELYEDTIFGTSLRSNRRQPALTIPTLTTLKFRHGIPLDRAYNLLSSSITSTVRRLLVPWYHGDVAGLNEEGKPNQFAALAALCEPRGVEIVLFDEEGF
jgi:hypothetical protein